MLFGDEQLFFRKLLSDQGCCCRCNVTEAVLQQTFERVGNEVDRVVLLESEGVAACLCPTSRHVYVLRTRPSFSIEATVIYKHFWWQSTTSEIKHYCDQHGATFEMVARKFYDATTV
jgi:hypothetical protein